MLSSFWFFVSKFNLIFNSTLGSSHTSIVFFYIYFNWSCHFYNSIFSNKVIFLKKSLFGPKTLLKFYLGIGETCVSNENCQGVPMAYCDGNKNCACSVGYTLQNNQCVLECKWYKMFCFVLFCHLVWKVKTIFAFIYNAILLEDLWSAWKELY